MTTPIARPKLDEDQRALAARAFAIVRPFIRHAESRYAPIIDVQGAIGERICCRVAEFDATKSSLKTWAYQHARYAVLDELRRSSARPFAWGHADAPRVLSLDEIESRRANRGGLESKDVSESENSCLAVHAVPGRVELDDAAAWVLRGLDATARRVLVGSIVEDMTLDEVADELGLSQPRVSQLRARSLDWLRMARKPRSTAI